MKRRQAREILFALIYEGSFDYPFEGEQDRSKNEIYENAKVYREFGDDSYIRECYFGIWDKIEEIDKQIAENALSWSKNRISKVTLALLRLCVYEMLYRDDIPFNVAINEAIELAKVYDHEKAPKFINGIANKIASDNGLKKSDKNSSEAKAEESTVPAGEENKD